MEELDIWLLKNRVQEVGTMFRACWDLYIKFYAVFLPYNLTAMAIVADYKNTISQNALNVIAALFIFQNLLTAATSASLALYTTRAARDYALLEEALLGLTPMPSALAKTKAIPTKLAKYAAWANTGAMLMKTGVWLYIGFFSPHQPCQT